MRAPSRLVVCGVCGEKKRHSAKNMCHACYQRTRYNERVEVPAASCERCGRNLADGLCRWCREQSRLEANNPRSAVLGPRPSRPSDPPHRAWDGYTMRHYLSAETEARLVEWERRGR